MPDTYHLVTDDDGNPVVEIRRVETLDLRRARQTLVIMEMSLKQASERLAVLEGQHAAFRDFVSSMPAEGPVTP